VVDQEDVGFVAIIGNNQWFEQFGRPLGGRLWRDEAEPNRDAVDVGIDGERRHAEGEQKGAMGGLRPDARESAEVNVRGLFVQILEMLKINLAVIGADLAEDRLNARGLQSG
jgi:hypothetical protein